MPRLIPRFIELMRKGYSVERVSREMGISINRARLIASTIVANGLVRPIDPGSLRCDSCESCPLKKVCGFTPIRPSEQS